MTFTGAAIVLDKICLQHRINYSDTIGGRCPAAELIGDITQIVSCARCS